MFIASTIVSIPYSSDNLFSITSAVIVSPGSNESVLVVLPVESHTVTVTVAGLGAVVVGAAVVGLVVVMGVVVVAAVVAAVVVGFAVVAGLSVVVGLAVVVGFVVAEGFVVADGFAVV